MPFWYRHHGSNLRHARHSRKVKPRRQSRIGNAVDRDTKRSCRNRLQRRDYGSLLRRAGSGRS